MNAPALALTQCDKYALIKDWEAMNQPVTKTVTFLKKNGAVHWRKCAEFYGVKQGKTAKEWDRCGAPLFDPVEMKLWLENRQREWLRKISDKSGHYADKEDEIVRLYKSERMGLRAISHYFSGRPTMPGVRLILIRRGVYRGEKVFEKQKQDSRARRALIIANEKRHRHEAAVCLWQLRKGAGVETTCKANGWNLKSIWNYLSKRASYRHFIARRQRIWPAKRKYGNNYSRKFPKESAFKAYLISLLHEARIDFVEECRLPNSRTRIDFKLADGTFIECKVALNSGQTYEAIGQAMHYGKHSKKVVLCVPDDIEMRKDLHELFVAMGVTVCNQLILISFLKDELALLPSNAIVEQQKVLFICKCCGSNEKRRHRMNSYCVECAPLIPKMTFDYVLNRWMRNAENHT
ncbi:MAG: hypothetical protein JO117_07950 [Verrucomicrobia bacterium]|nr:hypothetical protein [Verrucomicrobiota bacterium]